MGEDRQADYGRSSGAVGACSWCRAGDAGWEDYWGFSYSLDDIPHSYRGVRTKDVIRAYLVSSLREESGSQGINPRIHLCHLLPGLKPAAYLLKANSLRSVSPKVMVAIRVG